MQQRLRLDRHNKNAYYAAFTLATLALAGCSPGLAPIAPRGLAATDRGTVVSWARESAPRVPLRYDLRWKYVNDRGSAGGRASVRLVPPDSLRFDYRGPFGRSGAAVVVGDSGIWGEPEGDVRNVVRIAPLFWAAIGAPLEPPVGAETFGFVGPDRRAWRYIAGRDTFDLVELGGAPRRVLAQLRQAGRLVGATDTRRDAQGQPVEGRLDLLLDESRFTFTVVRIDTLRAVDPTIWRHP